MGILDQVRPGSSFAAYEAAWKANQPSQPSRSSGGGGGIDYNSILQQTQQRESASIAANQQRLDQATAIYDEIIARYRPGGSFGKGYLAQLETQKVQDVGKATQQQISSGLAGTTVTSGLGSAWEANVGQPARLKLEDIQMERLSGAQANKAGLIERVENPSPDYGLLAQLAAAQGQGGGGGSGGGGGGGGFSLVGKVGGSQSVPWAGQPGSIGGPPGTGTGMWPKGGSLGGFVDDPDEALKKQGQDRQTIAGMWATQDFEDLMDQAGIPDYADPEKTKEKAAKPFPWQQTGPSKSVFNR